MSLIFTRFPDMDQARAFAAAVKDQHGLDGQVFDDAVAAHNHDPFPWVQHPPVVHIDRELDGVDSTVATEDAVIAMVPKFGGVYVGT